MKAIEMVAGSVCCDAPGCGYVKAGVEMTPPSLAAYVDAPCPDCGAVLLTKADYAKMTEVYYAIQVVNAMAEAAGLPCSAEHQRAVRIKSDGLGNVGVTIPAVTP